MPVPAPFGDALPETALVAQVLDYAIFALDRYGVIRSWNAGAQRLKGWTSAEAVGQHFSMFYTEDDRRRGLPLKLLCEAREQGRVADRGWRVRKDGSQFWGDVVITALHDEDGELTGYAKVTRDLTEQHELEVSLHQSEERLRLLVSQVVDYAIVALDRYGVVRTWNAGAQRLKGYDAAEAIGSHFSMFYTEDDRHAGLPLELLRRAQEHGRVEHTGWRVRKDGSRFWGDVVITALYDSGGTLTGYAKVTKDLTEQHRVEEQQASMFATLSHDLRNPIHSISQFANLMRDAEPTEREHFAQRIVANAARLDALITGMFDYSKLRAGSITVHVEPLTLTKIVREALEDHATLLDGRAVALCEDESVLVLADRGAVHRVLDNLLTNACKYSPPGSPIEISCDADAANVRLTVTDHGRGIAPDDIPLMFSEFVRGRLAQDDGGTGLGLASVKKLVALQGGQVWIESELGRGTSVTVELPRAASFAVPTA